MSYSRLALWVFTFLTLCFPFPPLLPDAEACGPPLCYPTYAAPFDEVTIPANSPALAFMPGSLVPEVPLSDHGLVLETTEGVPVPFTANPIGPSGLILLVPDEPFVPGSTYHFRFLDPCPSSYSAIPPEEPVLTTHRFSVGDLVQIDRSPPNVEVTSHEVRQITVLTGSGACTATILADVVELQVSHPVIQQFPSLVALSTSIDGAPFQRRTLPAEDWHPDDGVPGYDLNWHPGRIPPPLVLHAACPPLDPWDDNGLPEGVHKIKVQISIEGDSELIPPTSVEVNFQCPSTHETEPDVSTSDDVLDQDQAKETGGTPEVSHDSGATTADSSASTGCIATPSHSPPLGSTLVLALCYAIASRRRRPRPQEASLETR